MKTHTINLILRQVERIESYITLPNFNPLAYRRLVSHLVDLCESFADTQFKEEIEQIKKEMGEAKKTTIFLPNPRKDQYSQWVERAFTCCVSLLARKELL